MSSWSVDSSVLVSKRPNHNLEWINSGNGIELPASVLVCSLFRFFFKKVNCLDCLLFPFDELAGQLTAASR